MNNFEDIKVGSYFYLMDYVDNIDNFCWEVVKIKKRVRFDDGFDDVFYIARMVDQFKPISNPWRKKTIMNLLQTKNLVIKL